MGVHSSHGEPFFEDLLDVADLAKARPRQAILLMVGDWNCGLLLEIELGDYEFRDDEPNGEELGRGAPRGDPGAAGSEERIGRTIGSTLLNGSDEGAHSMYVSPTSLDWVMCEVGAVRKFELHWRAAPGDHAICVVEAE